MNLEQEVRELRTTTIALQLVLKKVIAHHSNGAALQADLLLAYQQLDGPAEQHAPIPPDLLRLYQATIQQFLAAPPSQD